MKKLLIPLFFAFPLIAHSQTIYTIPWATQQPAWVFPIFAEDGAGMKDTLYIGFDSSASFLSYSIQDSIYGTKLVDIDTTKFNGIWDNIVCTTGTCKGYKANVTSINSSVDFFPSQWSFRFFKGVLPLKISWDWQLFNSDSLPFSGLPPAQGHLIYNFFNNCHIRENFNRIIPPFGTEILICHGNCNAGDSIVIYNYLGMPGIVDGGYIDLYIEPYTDGWVGVTETNVQKKDYKIEFDSEQYFLTNGSSSINIIVQDLLGRTIINTKIRENDLYYFSFPETGIYIIKIISNNSSLECYKLKYYEK